MPISIEKARELPTEKKSMGAVAVEELLEFLSDQACNAAEIAEFLQVKKEGVYTKLKRLVEEGLLTKVYDEGLTHWYAA